MRIPPNGSTPPNFDPHFDPNLRAKAIEKEFVEEYKQWKDQRINSRTLLEFMNKHTNDIEWYMQTFLQWGSGKPELEYIRVNYSYIKTNLQNLINAGDPIFDRHGSPVKERTDIADVFGYIFGQLGWNK